MGTHGKIRAAGLGITASILVAAASCGVAGLVDNGPPGPSARGVATDPWASRAAGSSLVTDPTPYLNNGRLTFLRQAAARTWSLLSGPGLNPATHLPRDSVLLDGPPGSHVTLQPPSDAQEYTNPALIGSYLSSIVAARDLGLVTADQAQTAAAATLGEIEGMARYRGFLFRWYSTKTGSPIDGPRGDTAQAGYVSSVDNGWLGQGLLVARSAFPALAARFGTLLDAMDWQFLYDQADNVLYNGYQVGGDYSRATYQNAYSGPRIAEYMAIGSGKVPGALWWGLNRTPPADHRQRQVPRGTTVGYVDPQNHRTYQIFEGHYAYDGIQFVPTFSGSMFQALAPDLVFPEQTMAPDSLGLNDRNTALAHGAYAADGAKTPVWGWAPAIAPGDHPRYTNYGAAPLAIDQGAIAHDVVTPSAAFLALPVIPDEAFANIAALRKRFPTLYTQYGFLDSASVRTSEVATRFMAQNQMTILMAIDNAVDHDQLQTYTAHTPYTDLLAPYMSMEHYSIQGVGPSATSPAATSPAADGPAVTSSRPTHRPRRRVRGGSAGGARAR